MLFEGRFDPARIAKALKSRKANLRTSPAGEYWLPKESGDEPGAVAIVNRGLIVCGNEATVVATLARRESGGDGGLTSGQGIGKHLSRIDRDASAWALVDVARIPSAPGREDPGDGEPSRALFCAMKSVSMVALQATVKSDGVEFAATGLSRRTPRTGPARRRAPRHARDVAPGHAEKSPELVSVIRRFQIDNDSEGVSIRGMLPPDSWSPWPRSARPPASPEAPETPEPARPYPCSTREGRTASPRGRRGET